MDFLKSIFSKKEETQFFKYGYLSNRYSEHYGYRVIEEKLNHRSFKFYDIHLQNLKEDLITYLKSIEYMIVGTTIMDLMLPYKYESMNKHSQTLAKQISVLSFFKSEVIHNVFRRHIMPEPRREYICVTDPSFYDRRAHKVMPKCFGYWCIDFINIKHPEIVNDDTDFQEIEEKLKILQLKIRNTLLDNIEDIVIKNESPILLAPEWINHYNQRIQLMIYEICSLGFILASSSSALANQLLVELDSEVLKISDDDDLCIVEYNE